MALATLTIDLVAKLASLERDMGRAAQIAERNAKRMESAFAGVKTSLAAIGSVLTVGAFAGMVRSVADAGDQLQKLSTKTGATVEELSKLQYAASLSDLSNEDLGASLVKLNKVMGEAADGSKQATEALARFGIAPDSSMTAIDAFKQIADRVKATGDETKIASGLNDVFGKSFASLIPLLKGGSEELTKAGDELERMGGVMSGELAAASEKFNDNLTKIGASLESLKVQSLGPTVEGLESLTSKFNEATKAAGGFWSGLMTWATTGGDQESNPAGAIVEITKKLNTLKETKQGLEAPTIANKLGFNTEDIAIVNTQIDVLTKQLAYLQNLNTASVGNIKDSWIPTVSTGITGTPTPPRKTGGGGSPERVAELTASTRDYQAAMDALNSTLQSAEAATQGLDAAQEALHKLMTGAEWATYPEAMKWAAIETASYASGALSAANAQQRLNDLMAGTPTAQLEKAQQDAELLEQALSKAANSPDYKKLKEALDAVYLSTARGNEKLEEMSEYAKSAAKNIQSSFADFLYDPFKDGVDGMLENFTNSVRRMAAEAAAARLSESLFGDLLNAKGGSNKGLIGDWFSTLFPNADGGVYSSPGLSAYSGSVVSKPTVFPFAKGIGLMGEAGAEAILPLKRGSDGKLGVSGGGANVIVNVIESNEKAGTQQQRQGSGGENIIDVFVAKIKGDLIKDIGSGGSLAGAMESQYALNRSAGAWR